MANDRQEAPAFDRVVLEIDRSALFDMVAKTGDGGEAVGTRLVGLLLGDDSFSTALGLAVYGIAHVLELHPVDSRAQENDQ